MDSNQAYRKLIERKEALLDRIAPHFHAYKRGDISILEYKQRVQADVDCLRQVANLIARFESKAEVES